MSFSEPQSMPQAFLSITKSMKGFVFFFLFTPACMYICQFPIEFN